MKHSKFDVRCKFSCLPKLRFDDQQLSSFSGLIVFQKLINDLELKRRLSRCFEHQKGSPSYALTSIVLILVILVLLGYRRLRDVQFFKDEPFVGEITVNQAATGNAHPVLPGPAMMIHRRFR